MNAQQQNPNSVLLKVFFSRSVGFVCRLRYKLSAPFMNDKNIFPENAMENNEWNEDNWKFEHHKFRLKIGFHNIIHAVNS